MLGSAPRLRGRDAERDQLRQAIDTARLGRLTVTLIAGEAGIGKTTLLNDALQSARERGLATLVGRANELEQARPFGVLADALTVTTSSTDPRRAEVAALISPNVRDPEPITVTSDPGLRFRVIDAIVDLVEAQADQGPLVLAVDDMQWIDSSTVLALTSIARRLTHSPIAVLACLRPIPHSGCVGQALRELDALGSRTLALGRLSDKAVEEMVSDMVGARPGEKFIAEMAAAGGNPLFIAELLAAMQHSDTLQSVDGRVEISRVSLPPSLRLTLLRKISYLPDEALRTLRSAVLLGTRFSLTDLSTITSAPASKLFTSLTAALEAGVLEGDGERLRFRHDLLHEALYDDIPEAVRTALHREAALRLAQAGAPALQIAEHWIRAAAGPNPDALEYLTRAARQVAASSPGSAVGLFGHAIGLLGPHELEHDRLLIEQAITLVRAGRIAEAETGCLTLLSRPGQDRQVEASARICLGHVLLAQGRLVQSLKQLEPLRQSTTSTDAERAAAWGWTAMAHLALAQPDQAARAATRARELAIASREHFIASLAISSQAMVHELHAQPATALQIIDEAIQHAEQSPGRAGYRYPIHVTRGHILMDLDRLGESIGTLEAGMRISEEMGVRWSLSSFAVYLALAHYLRGNWDECVADFERARELAAETGEQFSLVIGYCLMALVALHSGNLPTADRAVTAAEDELSSGRRYRGHWVQWVRALLHEARGDGAAAFDELQGCWKYCVDSDLHAEYFVLGPDLVRIAVGAGHPDCAARVAAAVAASLSDPQLHSAAATVLHCAGLASGDSAALLAAAERYDSAERQFASAQAREDAGILLARRNPGAAIPVLHQAASGFNGLGAERHRARCQAVLRSLGVRTGVRRPRTKAQSGWESLTAAECNVVDLVCQGLSNPEIGERLFVSRRTVQSHLAHIFAKLNVSSRTQLATEAARR